MRRSRLVVVALVATVVLGLAVAVGLGDLRQTGYDDSDADHAAGTPGVPAAAEQARVSAHVDGDTIRLTAERGSRILQEGPETTVRLLEIDTPERARDGSPAECYAEEASRALAEMLPTGSEVWVKPDRELLDPYGRTLLYLWTTDGVFVNLELVRQGHAEVVLFEPNDEYVDRMRKAEEEARADDRGLWAACRP